MVSSRAEAVILSALSSVVRYSELSLNDFIENVVGFVSSSLQSMSNSQYQAVILAAGRGVRMRSNRPKVLHKVCGLTLLERAMRAVAVSQVSRIVVVAGYGEELVREEVSRLSESARFKGKEIVVDRKSVV